MTNKKVNQFTRGEWYHARALAGWAVRLKGSGSIFIIRDSSRFDKDTLKANAQLIATAGTTASKLSEMGYDAVKVIENAPNILTSYLESKRYYNPHSADDFYAEIENIIECLKVK